MKGGGNQSSLGTAVKAAGYADGSRSPSTGRILPVAEQVRSSGRYRESGRNGPEELVVDGYGCAGPIVEKWAVGREALSWQAIGRKLCPLLIRQYPQPGAKRCQASGTYPSGAEREGYLPRSARSWQRCREAKAKTPIQRVRCRRSDTDNAEILPLTQ